jgi:hypothetical protein
MAIMGRSIREDMNARYDLVDESDLLAAVDRMTEVFSASAYLYVYQGGVNEGYVFDFFISKKRPCRGGYPAGSVGGGNEGKEETSFRVHCTTMQSICHLCGNPDPVIGKIL